MNTTGILLQWADSPGDYLFDLTAIVAGYSEELLSGEQVIISSGQKPYDGLPVFILIYPSNDNRVKSGCALQCQHERPSAPPSPPPS